MPYGNSCERLTLHETPASAPSTFDEVVRNAPGLAEVPVVGLKVPALSVFSASE